VNDDWCWGCECYWPSDWFRFHLGMLAHNLAIAAGLQLAYEAAEVDCAFRPLWVPGQGERLPWW
jgi:hypothetical protein